MFKELKPKIAALDPKLDIWKVGSINPMMTNPTTSAMMTINNGSISVRRSRIAAETSES